ncbi:MAG: TetR/AcrR family transcriptional regulator C-terminal domain-containing protein [Oscillospiraceae bacterium]
MSNYTQKAIIHTFQDMLQNKPFDKITVSAIVAKCEISSNTFYYHFQDIYDLLDTWLQLMWKKYFTDAMQSMTWQQALKILLRDMKQNSDLVYHLSGSISRERIERFVFESTGNIFYQMVCREVGDAAVDEKTLRSIAEYNSYSLLGFFLKFLWNHMNGDIDEGVDQISYIFKGNVQWIIKMKEDQQGEF